MTTNMTPDTPDPKDSRGVYDRDAVGFRQRAPELITYRYIVAPALHRYLQSVPRDREAKHVLDVGSASGRNVHLLIDEGFEARNIWGVEISPEQVAIAQREIPEATFEVGDISQHFLPPKTFDLAIMVMVPEFLDPMIYPQALKNIFTSMKPGGTFIYVTTHPDRYEAKYRVTSGEVITHGPWGGGEFTNYVRGVNQQSGALRKAGFSIQDTDDLDLPRAGLNADPHFAYPNHHVRLAMVAEKPKR